MIRSPIPEHVGERRFAEKLKRIEDQDFDIWFDLKHIQGLKNIDVLLIHQRIGVFVIEVKAVPLRMIYQYGLNKSEIGDRGEGFSPPLQAYNALYTLKNFLKKHGLPEPFLVPTAAFPDIKRSEWNQKWDSPLIAGEYADKLIFAEDLEHGKEGLVKRLNHIYMNPPYGEEGFEGKFRYHKAKPMVDYLNLTYSASKPKAVAGKPDSTNDDNSFAGPESSGAATVEGVGHEKVSKAVSGKIEQLENEQLKTLLSISELEKQIKNAQEQDQSKYLSEIHALREQHRKYDELITVLHSDRQMMRDELERIDKKIEYLNSRYAALAKGSMLERSSSAQPEMQVSSPIIQSKKQDGTKGRALSLALLF